MIDTLRLSIDDPAFFYAVVNYRKSDLGGTLPARINADMLREMVSSDKVINFSDYKDKQLRELLEDLNSHGLNIVLKDLFQLFSQGSWNRDISLCIDEFNHRIITEVSIPKFFNGQNVDLTFDYKSKILDFVIYLYRYFKVTIPTAERIMNFELHRVDICYYYMFDSQIHANDFIRSFKSWSKHKRKRVHHYDTSMMFVGKSYSLKFYQKYNEFQSHDKKFINKRIADLMEKNDTNEVIGYREILRYCDEKADGMIRAEFTIRKAKLMYDNIFTLKDLFELDICEYYEKLLAKIGVLNMGHTKKDDCFNKLKTDKKLLAYVALLDTFGRDKIKEVYERTVIYKYDKMLEAIGISMNDFSILKDVSLKVRHLDKLSVLNESDNYKDTLQVINGNLPFKPTAQRRRTPWME